MTVGACAVAAMLLPLKVCVAWAAIGLGVEFWSWFASRAQFLRKPVSRAAQVNYLVNLLVLIANWFVLAVLFWRTHHVEGGLCAVIIWLSVIGFAQTFASRTPLGFTVSGVLPAFGMFAVVFMDPLYAGMRWGPILGMLMLATAFAIAGGRQTFATGRRYDEAQSQLRGSEAQYRVLANNITDVIARNTPDGERRYISPSVEAVMGYTPEEFGAMEPLSHIHPEDREMVRSRIVTMFETGGDCLLEYRLFRKDGTLSWMETSFRVVTDPVTGEQGELVSTSRDISGRKAMEHDLMLALERAEAGAAAKADFLANMTHELRTPLNAIVGFSSILKASGDLVDQDRRHARLISEASATLLGVVNSVLDFSKLESGAFEFDPRPFDPVEITRSVVMMIEDQALARGLRLEVRTSGENPGLAGDAPRIQQVLLNLLGNALKFTAAGGIDVLIEQTPTGDGAQRLRMAVSDTGIGIAPDQIDAIFERFNQADGTVSRRFGGTGLGLAICKRIVELMGGQIGVTSREGEGSTFWFEVSLPISASTGIQEGGADQARLERPLRLLLVEDVDVNRELMRAVLADFDIEIDEAVNGAEAVAAAGRSEYDVVLMDVQMPVMDGLTATRLIRANALPTAKRLPIIAMTANVLPEQIHRCLAAGMDAHLGKPIEPARLLEALSTWTTEHQPGEELNAPISGDGKAAA